MSASVAVANKKYIRWDDNGQYLTKLLFQKIIQWNAHLPNDHQELEGKLWEHVNRDFFEDPAMEAHKSLYSPKCYRKLKSKYKSTIEYVTGLNGWGDFKGGMI